jgi:hypothetical protein
LLVGLGMMIGTLVTLGNRPAHPLQLPETLLHATASHSGKTMAMATGWVDDETEGLFVLDYLTGDLQCFIVNPRNVQPPMSPYSIFRTNIIGDLEVQTGKEPSYTMVTGQVRFRRGTGAGQPAQCMVYVGDSNSGNFVAYTLLWNRTLSSSGGVQQGQLMLITKGNARALEIREP